jgi:hypothetical protein
MTRGTWQTTGDGGDAAKAVTAVVGVALAGALAYGALKGAAHALGEVAVIGTVAAVALVAGAGVTLLAVRMRRRRGVQVAAQPVRQLWHVRADALPHREAPQVGRGTAPAVEHHYHGPQFVINGDAGQESAARLIRQALAGAAPEHQEIQ